MHTTRPGKAQSRCATPRTDRPFRGASADVGTMAGLWHALCVYAASKNGPGGGVMGHRTSIWIALFWAAAVAAYTTLDILNFPRLGSQGTAAVAAGTQEPRAARPKLPPEQESLARAATEHFAQAEEVRSVNGLLRTTLVVKYGD